MSLNRWKAFNFKEIFEFERGERLIRENQVKGNIAYVSSTKKNNGVDNYIIPPERMKIYKNCITLNNSGSVGCSFYHDYDFVASDHATVIWIKDKNVELNKSLGMYLTVIFEQMKGKYNFAREISNERLEKENVRLPINSENKPDWKGIQEYIETLCKNIEYNNKKLARCHDKEEYNPIDTKKWKKFKVKQLFQIERGRIGNVKEIDSGRIPLVSSSSFNNGVYMLAKVEPRYKNCITASFNGEGAVFFYHDYEFNANQDCGVLIPEFEINKYNALFLINILNQMSPKYSFSRKLTQEKLEEEVILLPSKDKKNPDWEYIEQYIKGLPYAVNF